MDSKRHTDSGIQLTEAIDEAYRETGAARAIFRLASRSTDHEDDFSQEDAVAFRDAGQELAEKITGLHAYLGDL